MKKLLSFIGAIGMVASVSSTVISCDRPTTYRDVEVEFNESAFEIETDIVHQIYGSDTDVRKDEESGYAIFDANSTTTVGFAWIFATRDGADDFISDMKNNRIVANDDNKDAVPLNEATNVEGYAYVLASADSDTQKTSDLLITFEGNITFK